MICQRWKDGTHSWRRTSEGGFDPALYSVSPVVERDARSFVIDNHYSGSYPAARFRYGLFEAARLVGVAVLSVPVQKGVLTIPFPTLRPYDESLELGRFVLLDYVPANAESWFIARVWKLAKADGIRGVVSFSDPVPRTTSSGTVCFPGHVGTIYQASNAICCGRSRARRLTLTADGRVLNERSLSKLRNHDRGHRYVSRLLQDAGTVRKISHGGCHRYLFPLDRAVTLGLAPCPYPKLTDAVDTTLPFVV